MADDYVEEEGIGLTHWSRACGTGVGLSAHKNQYRHGVLIGNWQEDYSGFVQGRQANILQHHPTSTGLDGATTTARATFAAISSDVYRESLKSRAETKKQAYAPKYAKS